MAFECFQKQFIDDLTQVDPKRNYFIVVWDRVFQMGYVPRSLLDVGCGTGVFSMYAQEKTGCTLSGVDGSAYALQEARERGFTGVATIEDLNSSALPYPDSSFDFVLCKDVLEHLRNPLHVVRECRRVLASSGILLLHVPNHFPLIGRAKFLLNGNIDTFDFFPGATRWDFPHLRFFTHNEFVRVSCDVGFELVEDLSNSFPYVPLLNRMPGFGKVEAELSRRWPSQFAGGFTLLLKKAS